jgi:hypothetical protein
MQPEGLFYVPKAAQHRTAARNAACCYRRDPDVNLLDLEDWDLDEESNNRRRILHRRTQILLTLGSPSVYSFFFVSFCFQPIGFNICETGYHCSDQRANAR